MDPRHALETQNVVTVENQPKSSTSSIQTGSASAKSPPSIDSVKSKAGQIYRIPQPPLFATTVNTQTNTYLHPPSINSAKKVHSAVMEVSRQQKISFPSVIPPNKQIHQPVKGIQGLPSHPSLVQTPTSLQGSSNLSKADDKLQNGQESVLIRQTVEPRAKKTPVSMAITFNGSFEDECKSMLLKLLFSFHQAETSDNVVNALTNLFRWIKSQTYNPSPSTTPEVKPPQSSLLSLQLLRHAKNEFVQCAQIKQRRHPLVWSHDVAKLYTAILQHLMLSIQYQTNVQNQPSQRLNQQVKPLKPPTPSLQTKLQQDILQQQIKQRMQMNLTHAHAQFARQQHPVERATQVRPGPKTTPKPPKKQPKAFSSKDNPVNSPSMVNLTAQNISAQLAHSNDQYVDMTMRTAQSGGDDEQLYIPQRNITKVMRAVLPKDSKIKIDDEAKELIQECVTEFMLYLTSETRDQAAVHNRNKSTLTGHDAVKAMYNLGFTTYGDILTLYNEKIIAVQREANRTKSEKRLAKQKGLLTPTPTTPLGSAISSTPKTPNDSAITPTGPANISIPQTPNGPAPSIPPTPNRSENPSIPSTPNGSMSASIGQTSVANQSLPSTPGNLSQTSTQAIPGSTHAISSTPEQSRLVSEPCYMKK